MSQICTNFMKISLCWVVCEIGHLLTRYQNSVGCIIGISAAKTRIIKEPGSYDLLFTTMFFFVSFDCRPGSKNFCNRNFSGFPKS